MNKLKDVKIHDTIDTNMGGIRVSAPLISKETIDSGTLDQCVGIDSSDVVARGESASGSDLPEVSGADNGSVLEVIAGLWGKGGKKVNVIDAPASTTLDDDTINKIKQGVFINGAFLGLTNPVLFPCKETVGTIQGVVISAAPDEANVFVFTRYTINKTTKVINIPSNAEFMTMNMYSGKFNLKNIISFNGQSVVDGMLALLSLSIPADASSKTYVPKLINGTWTLVEEV